MEERRQPELVQPLANFDQVVVLHGQGQVGDDGQDVSGVKLGGMGREHHADGVLRQHVPHLLFQPMATHTLHQTLERLCPAHVVQLGVTGVFKRVHKHDLTLDVLDDAKQQRRRLLGRGASLAGQKALQDVVRRVSALQSNFTSFLQQRHTQPRLTNPVQRQGQKDAIEHLIRVTHHRPIIPLFTHDSAKLPRTFETMRIDIVTVLPGLLKGPFDESIVKRGIDKGLVEVHVHNLRDWSTNKHKKVDDAPFGTAAGMVLAMQPLHDAITDLQSQRAYDEVIFLTPDGETLAQPRVNQLSLSGNLMLICGHYKGIDQRLRDHVITLELSIGDYVLSGGELAAAVLTDALVRLVPGVIGDETSALSDSFQDGLLAPPVYTRPAEYNGWKVPDVLLSGNHAAIDAWQEAQALARTKARRPDLLEGREG